jgi:hypothetical protein
VPRVSGALSTNAQRPYRSFDPASATPRLGCLLHRFDQCSSAAGRRLASKPHRPKNSPSEITTTEQGHPPPSPPRGNRQLALHIIAITRGRIDPTTRAYLARKATATLQAKARSPLVRSLRRPSRPVT